MNAIPGSVFLSAGVALAVTGGLLWWQQEKTRQLISPTVMLCIALILCGAFFIGYGLEKLLHLWKNGQPYVKNGTTLKWSDWFFILGLIFVGSVSYTIAAYYHLNMEASSWTFLKAFAIAVPFILIEYQFSIRGNYHAKNILGMSAVQITLLTMIFYFINSWVLSYFVLNQAAKLVWWREVAAFLCIAAAFLLTTRIT